MGNFGDADKEFAHDNNPRWIVSKYANRCRECSKKTKVGARVIWYPREKGVVCGRCAEQPRS